VKNCFVPANRNEIFFWRNWNALHDMYVAVIHRQTTNGTNDINIHSAKQTVFTITKENNNECRATRPRPVALFDMSCSNLQHNALCCQVSVNTKATGSPQPVIKWAPGPGMHTEHDTLAVSTRYDHLPQLTAMG